MRTVLAITMIMAATPLFPASAQNTFGDTQLSYFNGVVYDDDLVPGRPPNQSFLAGEQVTPGTAPGVRVIPRSSRNLIGADGRIIERNQPAVDRLR
jgi:hypothetical protein